MEPNFLGTPIVTSVMNSARETTVTVVVSTQESPGANMEEISNDNNPGTSVAENASQSQVQTKNSDGVVPQTSNRTHKIDASTTMGVLSPSLSVPPVQVPATPLKLQQLLTQTHQQPTVESSSVVVQLPVSAPACSQSDPATISLPSSIPSVLHSQGMPAQPVVVQVGHQGRQQVTCVPSNQNVGISGQRNQECHLLQPHASLMPSVVVQVAKGAQKVVPTPVVTQSGARVVPILPLYLQPAGGASGGLTAVMNPMPQVVTGGGGRAAGRTCGIPTSSSSSQTMGGTSAAAEAIVKKKKPIAPTPTHFLPLSLPLPLPLPLPMGTQSQQGHQRLGCCTEPPSDPHTTASATTTTFAYVGTIIEGASGRGSGTRAGDEGPVGVGGIPPPGSKVLLAPSLSVLPHRGAANASGGIPGSMSTGTRLLLPMGSGPPSQAAPSTINLKISNGQIQGGESQPGLNVLKEARSIMSATEQIHPAPVREMPVSEMQSPSIPFQAVTLTGQQGKIDRNSRTYLPAIVTTASVQMAPTVTCSSRSLGHSPPASPQVVADNDMAGERMRRLGRDLNRCLQEVMEAFCDPEENSVPPPSPSPPTTTVASPPSTTTTCTNTTTTTTTTATLQSMRSISPAPAAKLVPKKEESINVIVDAAKVDPEEAAVNTEKTVFGEERSETKTVSPSEANLEEFDPIKVLEWQDGVGTLPGSNLKFRLNEFGIMEMVEDETSSTKLENVEDSNSKHESLSKTPENNLIIKKDQNELIKRCGEETPMADQEGEVKIANNLKGCLSKATSPSASSASLNDSSMASGGDDIRCCEGCGCYGLVSEFLSGRFCGKGCADQVAAMALAARRVREARLRQKKRRQKRREIMRAAAIAMGSSVGETAQSGGGNDSSGEAPSSLMQTAPEVEGARQQQQQQPSQGSLKHTPVNSEEDNTSNDALPTEVRSKTESSSSHLPGSRVPWKVGKNGFSWTKYLDHVKAKAAPQYLFRDIYPFAKNSFKAGMKLEGIDPEHPSLFCVLTVAQVRGYRMRLHFDGYPDIHDFWTNADSPDLFPVGWCEKNSHRLQPPKGYTGGVVGSDGGEGPIFNWATYLKQCRAQAAPRHLFAKKAYSICPTGFRTGMKLEAVDRKNQSLVCVATVADLLDSRILVHFDGWADVYDYWADPSSPYIHPVGWCKENGHPLTPPNGYASTSPFSWEKYLAETGAVAAPARAFKQRPPSGFRSGMRLEAVDPRVPSLVRVATVDEVRGHRLRLRFDGWSWNQDYAFWIDDDSPDIHPVGWCMQTGHPLEPPLTAEEAAMWPRIPDACPTPGCRGLGNSRGAPYAGHMSPSACPLTSKVLPPLPDRLDPSVLRIRHSGEEEEEGIAGDEAEREDEEAEGESEDDDEEEEEEEETKPPPPKIKRSESPPASSEWEGAPESRPAKPRVMGAVTQNPPARQQPSGLPPPPPLRLGPAHLPGYGRGIGRGTASRTVPRHDGPTAAEARDVRRDVHRSVFSPGYMPNPDRVTPLCWDRHSRLLYPYVNGDTLPGREASRWTRDEVVKFVENIPGCKERAKVFRDEQIDGEAFLLLNQNDIVTLLGFKLGPAIKVYNSIVLLRQRLTT